MEPNKSLPPKLPSRFQAKCAQIPCSKITGKNPPAETNRFFSFVKNPGGQLPDGRFGICWRTYNLELCLLVISRMVEINAPQVSDAYHIVDHPSSLAHMLPCWTHPLPLRPGAQAPSPPQAQPERGVWWQRSRTSPIPAPTALRIVVGDVPDPPPPDSPLPEFLIEQAESLPSGTRLPPGRRTDQSEQRTSANQKPHTALHWRNHCLTGPASIVQLRVGIE